MPARQAELKMEQGKGKVYVYYGQWNTPLGQGALKIKAFHTSDLPLTMRLVLFPGSRTAFRGSSAARGPPSPGRVNPSQKGRTGPCTRRMSARPWFSTVRKAKP